MAEISFTPEQVVGAIRHGMRGDRQRYELGTDDAVHKSATYEQNLSHYRDIAHRCLADGDYLQAAEKSWGAYTQTIKTICADHRVRVSTHSNILSVAQSFNTLATNADATIGDRLRQGFRSARSLHQHFYENDLDGTEVETSVEEVMDAIDLLKTLFDGNGAAGTG